jgi:phage shock protein PspC (stress-responsive transcriptional regulator)
MGEKLFRSRKYRILGGVAGGLAEYFKIDPVITRILFIAFILANGIGFAVYIILWIIVPDEPIENMLNDMNKKNDNPSETKFPDLEELKPPVSSNKSGLIFGIIITALGVIFLLSNILPFFDFDNILPVIFIIVGAFLIWNSTRSQQ